MYIFDEATSNIDMESESDIMREIHRLAQRKTVILISHRLANVQAADVIYVLSNGRLSEHGDHATWPAAFVRWNTQQSLENYGKEGDAR